MCRRGLEYGFVAAGERCAAVLHGPWVRAQLPSPRLWSGDADGNRASELQHAVEDMDRDIHLGRPTFVGA